MKRSVATFVVFVLLLLPASVEADQVAADPTLRVLVNPTLISARGGTLVTATLTEGRFYFSSPPPFRVRLYRRQSTGSDEYLNLLEPVTLTQTKITFRFPPLDPGFYGYVIRAQNTQTGVWLDVYKSPPRFFKVAPESEADTRVFLGLPREVPGEHLNPTEFITTKEITVRGVMSDGVAKRISLDGGVNLSRTKDFRWDGEGPAGVIFELDFGIDDAYAQFAYSIPFEMTFDLPSTVYAGQTIRFAPKSFRYLDGATLSVSHHFYFSTHQRLMLNVPYDTLPPLDIGFDQGRDDQGREALTLWGSVPLGPWLDKSFDISIPFGGDQEIEGVRIRSGGEASFTNTGGRVESLADGSQRVWTEEGRAEDLWYSEGDLITFLAYADIPYVSQAAMVLAAARVELNQYFDLDVVSTDLVAMMPPDLFDDFEVDIPSEVCTPELPQPRCWVPLRGPYNVADKLSFTFKAIALPQYVYQLEAGFNFDMPFIHPVSLGSWNRDNIFANAAPWAVAPKRVEFQLDNYTVDVMAPEVWLPAFNATLPGVNLDLVNYTQEEAQQEHMRIANLPFNAPPTPPVVSTTIEGTFPTEAESEYALMLSSTPSAGGTITVDPLPVDGGYAAGTVVTLTAKAAIGYQFTGWSGDAAGSANPTTLTLNDVKSVTAEFSLTQAPCVGDCQQDGGVTVDEVLTMVNIALGNAEMSECESGDDNDDGLVTVDEILTAVNNALTGCAA